MEWRQRIAIAGFEQQMIMVVEDDPRFESDLEFLDEFFEIVADEDFGPIADEIGSLLISCGRDDGPCVVEVDVWRRMLVKQRSDRFSDGW